MATFLKGDIHGNLFEIIDFINRFNLGKNDNIIILGDCGIAWRKDKKDLAKILNFGMNAEMGLNFTL